MHRAEAIFTGRVQGVGFRATTCRVARGFDVAGWVRNEPDGSVRCVVEGDRAEVDRFLAAVGEAMARNIDGVRRTDAGATGSLRGFEVRR